MQLTEVLKLFDSPLSQEQCWAICYGVCKNLITKRNEDLQRKEKISYILNLDSLILTQRGEIEILQSEPNFHELQKDSELIFAIGNLMCRCLDYGLDELQINEVRFQDDLAELIGGMVLLNHEFDEGIVDIDLNESWGSRKLSAACRSFRTLNEVVRFCEARLLRRNIEARGSHYKSVCKALYIEISELKAFLGHVLYDYTEDRGSNLYNGPELAKKYVKDWAKLWISVMEELRQKTKDRRRKLLPEDYQFTPFEKVNFGSNEDLKASMNSTRNHNNFQRSDSLPSNAEDKILDFLRSRVSSHEEIRSNESGASETELNSHGSEASDTELNTCDEGTGDLNNLLAVDDNLLIENDKNNKNLNETIVNSTLNDGYLTDDNSIGSDDELSDLEDVVFPEKTKITVGEQLVRRISEWDEKSIENQIEQDFLDGLSDTEVESTDISPTVEAGNFLRTDSGRKKRLALSPEIVNDITDQTLTTQKEKFKFALDLPRISENSPLPKRRYTYSHKPRGLKKPLCRSMTNLNFVNLDDSNNEKIGCSLTEVFKIRQEVTRAELENTKDLDVKDCKKCFGCKRNKFSFFQRARNCTVCSRKYCVKCIREKSTVPTSLVDAVPPNLDVSYGSNIPLAVASRTQSAGNIQSLLQSEQDTFTWLETRSNVGLRLNMCLECKRFLESIDKEKQRTEWKVHLELDI